MSNENNEQNNQIEMPTIASNSEEVSMEVKSQADQINQMNNVMPEQVSSVPPVQPVMPQNVTEPVQNMFMPNQSNGNTSAPKMDIKVIVGIAVCAVIVFVLMLVLLLGNGGKGITKKFAKYYVKGDHQKIVEVYHDDFVDEYYKDLKDSFKEDFKERKEDDNVYKNYKILDKFKLTKDQVEDYAELIEKSYDIDEKDIKKVEQYLVKYKVDNDGEPAVDYQTIITVKVKGKWYVFNVPSGSIF